MARPRDFGVKSCDFSAPEFETRFSIIESPGFFSSSFVYGLKESNVTIANKKKQRLE